MAWSPVTAPSGSAVNSRGFVSAYQFSPSGAVTPTGGGGGSVGGAAMGGGGAPIRPVAPIAGSVTSSAKPSNLNYTPSLSGSGGSAGLPIPTSIVKPGSTPTPTAGGAFNNWQPLTAPTPPVDMTKALGSGGLSVPQAGSMNFPVGAGMNLQQTLDAQRVTGLNPVATNQQVGTSDLGKIDGGGGAGPIVAGGWSPLQLGNSGVPGTGTPTWAQGSQYDLTNAGKVPDLTGGYVGPYSPQLYEAAKPPILPPDPQTQMPYYMPSYQSPSSMAGGLVSSYATPGGSGYGGPSGSGSFGIEGQGKRKKSTKLGFSERA